MPTIYLKSTVIWVMLAVMILAGCGYNRLLLFQEEKNAKALPIDGWNVTIALKHYYKGEHSPIEKGIEDSLIPFAFWLKKSPPHERPETELWIDTMIVGVIDNSGGLQRVWVDTVSSPEEKRYLLYFGEPHVIFDSIPEYAIFRIYYHLVDAKSGREKAGWRDYNLCLSKEKELYLPLD